jgi:hypothetical protein
MSLHESDFDCPRCSDAAAYVLGALEDDELHLYRGHLDTCAQCRAEVAELQPVADELPAGVAPAVASEQLRERILATVRAEAELLDAAGERADRPPPREPRRRSRGLLVGLGAAAAACAAAAIAIAIGVGSSSGERVIPGQAPPGAQASLHQRDGRAELVVAGMPPPALGRIYEVWLSRGGSDAKPTNALFSVTNSGSGSVDVPNSLRGIKQVMVTSEPLGGSTHPTSPPLIRVLLRS